MHIFYEFFSTLSGFQCQITVFRNLRIQNDGRIVSLVEEESYSFHIRVLNSHPSFLEH